MPLNRTAATLLLLCLALPALAQGPAETFHVNKNLYSETADANAEIASAIRQATREHKRILLDFGGNWCGDCQLLDYYYHSGSNADLLTQHFVLVHIDIGHMDHNVDIAKRFGVPITHGVPALAVLDSHGKLLYAEREKEFEHTTPEAVAAFLSRWKG